MQRLSGARVVASVQHSLRVPEALEQRCEIDILSQ
jgi:hypothetical protein